MTAYTIEELVSQAESGGMTLADVLSSRLSAADLDSLQQDIAGRLSDNYKSIEGFMADVEVPSVAGLRDMADSELEEMQGEILTALSDTAQYAHS